MMRWPRVRSPKRAVPLIASPEAFRTPRVEQLGQVAQLVHALEVRDLGRVAAIDQRLERRQHERVHSAAQHGLLAEQVDLRLLAHRRRPQRGAAQALGVGAGECLRTPGTIAVHGEIRGHVLAALARPGEDGARRRRRDQHDIAARGQLEIAVEEVEPVREHQCYVVAGRAAQLGPQRRQDLVRQHDRGDVGRAKGVGERECFEAERAGAARAVAVRARPTTIRQPLARKFCACAEP